MPCSKFENPADAQHSSLPVFRLVLAVVDSRPNPHPVPGLDEVAAGYGFEHAGSMRRSFLRVAKVAPSDYRQRFRPVSAG